MPLLTISVLADSLLWFVGHVHLEQDLSLTLQVFLFVSPLGVSAQVTDLQVLLKAGYWSRQTSALTQYCSSYGSHSICLISGIYQLEEKT